CFEAVRSRREKGKAMSTDKPLFVYIKIPEALDPFGRGEKYEDPIQERLEALELGEVTGGGTMLSWANAEGERKVAFCGIDVDLFKPEAGLKVLKEELAKLGAPDGTILEYTIDGVFYSIDIYAKQ